MNQFKYKDSKLKEYFRSLSNNDEIDSRVNVDWNDFYNKSFKTSRNKKTLELLDQFSNFFPKEQNYISDNVLIVNSLDKIVKKLYKRAFVVADRAAYNFIKNHYFFDVDKNQICFIDEITSGNYLNDILNKIKKNSYSHLLAFGGGRTIDFAKFISLKVDLKLLSIPSSLATHVYASSKIHVLQPIKELGFEHTIDGESSHLSLIDANLLEKLFKLNRRLVLSGFGDIMAFINSRHDWKESSDEGNERYSFLVDQSIDFIVSNLEAIDIDQPMAHWIEDYIFIQCLLCNITEWVGSAPASGAEHLFAKCIEDDVNFPTIHGEIVALGVLIFCYVRNKDFDLVLRLLKKFNISSRLSDLGLNSEDVVSALFNSKNVGKKKGRFTLLNSIDTSKVYFNGILDEMISKGLIH